MGSEELFLSYSEECAHHCKQNELKSFKCSVSSQVGGETR